MLPRQKPYTAQQMEAIGRQLGSVYAEGEARILRILAQGSITDWKRAFLNEQLRQIRGILAELPVATREWAQLHLPGLYGAGVQYARAGLPGGAAVGIDPQFAALHQQAVDLIGQNLALKLDEAVATVEHTVKDVFRRAGLEQIQAGLVGGATRRDVSKALVADLQAKGLTSFTDKAGREWDLPRYAEMVARTTTREATEQGIRNSVLEAGIDLVIVSTHGGACELCQPWEGEVLSLTGATDGYPTLDDAEADGFQHPNCGHTYDAYIPELLGD